MEIRFNVMNSDVEETLEQIDKHNRKIFVETAILHYIKYLESNENATDIIYASRKKKEPKAESKAKPEKIKEPKVEKNKNKSKATDNTSLGAMGW